MTAAPLDEIVDADPVREARAAVAVGLWVCATRCLLTYVVAPGLGLLGVALGSAGLLLQLLGAVTSAAGALRLHRLGHRWWPGYALVAVAVTLTSVLAVAELVA